MSQIITVKVNAKLLTKSRKLRVRIARVLCAIASRLASARVEITVEQ